MEDGEQDDRPDLLDPDTPAARRRIWLIVALVAIGGLAVTLVSALVGVLT